jgi:ABC-type bacteriocin/lantibiotic exporter with double-glycine peptidase domain
MNFQWQNPNNCGPTSVAIVLGYYGYWITQQEVNEQIPAGSVADLVSYLSQYQLTARAYAVSSSCDSVRQLLANGIPLIVNQMLSAENSTRHYRILKGYDDTAREFIADDPLLGANFRIAYDVFIELSSTGAIIPIYPPDMDPLVQSLMTGLEMEEIPV